MSNALLKPEQVRQGDVLITPCLREVAPDHVGILIHDSEQKRTVLAYGEVTGHAHAFYEQDQVTPARVEMFKLKDNPGQCYAKTTFSDLELLRVQERSFLRHEEHGFVSFPPGDYVVIHQMESDDMGELRRVAD